MKEEIAKQLALGIACLCVRNTSLEDIHAGTVPFSNDGMEADVFVKTKSGNISWHEVSRISDDEMKKLMIEVTDRIFTVLMRLDDIQFLDRFEKMTKQYSSNWNEPRFLEDWLLKG